MSNLTETALQDQRRRNVELTKYCDNIRTVLAETRLDLAQTKEALAKLEKESVELCARWAVTNRKINEWRSAFWWMTGAAVWSVGGLIYLWITR